MTTKGHSAPGRPPIDPDVARFAAALRADERARADAARREADVRREQADEQARQEHHEQLRVAKDAAASRLREVRRTGRADAVAQAEAGYRDALAALVAFETGERPPWAPAPVAHAPEGEPDVNGEPDVSETPPTEEEPG
jgi:hypothetical protein